MFPKYHLFETPYLPKVPYHENYKDEITRTPIPRNPNQRVTDKTKTHSKLFFPQQSPPMPQLIGGQTRGELQPSVLFHNVRNFVKGDSPAQNEAQAPVFMKMVISYRRRTFPRDNDLIRPFLSFGKGFFSK